MSSIAVTLCFSSCRSRNCTSLRAVRRNFAGHFKHISEKHLCKISQRFGVGLAEFVGVVERSVSIHANKVCPFPNILCDFPIFEHPLETIVERLFSRFGLQGFRRDVECGSIHRDCGIPPASLEIIFPIQEALGDRLGNVVWRGRFSSCWPNLANHKRRFNRRLKRYWRCVVDGVLRDKGYWFFTSPAYSSTVPQIQWPLWESCCPSQSKCHACGGAVGAIANYDRHCGSPNATISDAERRGLANEQSAQVAECPQSNILSCCKPKNHPEVEFVGEV